MSRKKVYMTVGIAEELAQKVRHAAGEEYRSLSSLVEKILRKYFDEERGEEKINAHKA